MPWKNTCAMPEYYLIIPPRLSKASWLILVLISYSCSYYNNGILALNDIDHLNLPWISMSTQDQKIILLLT